MNDLDQQLRAAGARVRASAPTSEATDAALVRIGDVALDDRAPIRHRRWIVAPAVIAAAAATVALLVLTRPTEEAIVPATTVAPAPVTTVAGPVTTGPATTSTVATSDIGFGVSVQISDVDFDGDGGACLTLSTATDRATGCADGPMMRSAYGQPLLLRLDGRPYAFVPGGTDGSPELSPGNLSACFAAGALAGALVIESGCDADGTGILGTLPTTPDGVVTWTTVGAAATPEGVGLDEIAASESAAARIFRTRPTEVLPSCLAIASMNGVVREACGLDGERGFLLAGSPEAPLAIAYDLGALTASATVLDRATELVANGCRELTAGGLLTLLPAHATVTSLACADGAGIAIEPAALVSQGGSDGALHLLARAADGTWSLPTSGSGAVIDGEALPFPSPALIARNLGDTGPLDQTDRLRGLPTYGTSDPQLLASDLGAFLITDPDEGETVSVEVVADVPAIIVTLDGRLDDAASRATYVVWYVSDGTGLRVDWAFSFATCSRGVTDEGFCV